jgi:hypothetical protein
MLLSLSKKEVVIEILPYTKINDNWTVPEETIKGVFHKMHEDRTFRTVFYDGKVKTPDDLVKLLQSPANLALLHLVDGYVRGIAWINDFHDNHATAHFCAFKESWGEMAKVMGVETLRYWFGFKKQDGTPRFELILGVTPASYKRAIRFIQSIGFTSLVGEVPKILYDGYLNKRIPAVLSYCERFT